MKLVVAVALCLAAGFSVSSQAKPADKIKLGLLTTLSGPVASIGKEQEMGLDIALKQLGGKIGGIPVEVFTEDARMQADTAIQAAAKLTDQEHVDFLLGGMQSQQLLALLKPVTESGTIIVSAIAGPSELAGASCNRNLFVTSWENNTPSEAVGKAMTSAGKKNAFFIAQNYVSGREHVAGAKSTFKGTLAGESFVERTVTDFAAEISRIRAAKPDAVYIFMPGAQGIAFVKQYASSGLGRTAPLFSGSWLSDELSFAALGPNATDPFLAGNWFSNLNNPANKTFVEAFKKQYGRNPVFYAALVYDSVMLLDSAVREVKGDISDKDKLRAALRKADFKSVRGKFRFNTNQFPVQDFYEAKVVKSGDTYTHQVVSTVLPDHADHFASACSLR